MLSVKNLVKEYTTKNGQTVRALDGVTIDFPDSGMVFLLGKSGSGKSTLLNVAGGLDKPTDGEIIIDGKSSKDFKENDFDGYRNSCVGFVFQEFNILNEFSVGQNIALALQLQNRKDDKAAVKEILSSVDLEGAKDRSPTTLSGGQKQRVAIARALIKDPKIIMADEPTGALDSQTGKQIFETLKKLSKERLVVVVTHDREFAELYGDRIIELKDGKIVSDLSKNKSSVIESDNVTFVADDTVCVNDWDKVTDSQIKEIISVFKKNKGQTVITSRKNIEEGKKDLLPSGSTEKFTKTETANIERKAGGNVKFIKSTLPYKNAVKMAFDSLKIKPVRLVITILLSIIAFTFFGVAATFMLYDPDYSVATALVDSDYQSIVLEKRYDADFTARELDQDGKQYVDNDYTVSLRAAYTQDELEKFNDNNKGLKFAGVLDLGFYSNYLDSVSGYSSEERFTLRNVSVDQKVATYYDVRSLCGFSDCGEEFLMDNGFTLVAGRYPKNYTEIAVSEYVYEIYKNASEQSVSILGSEYPSAKSFIGATLNAGGMLFTVTGVYDVGGIPEKYDALLNNLEGGLDSYGLSKLKSQMQDVLKFSYHTLGFVSSDFYEHYGTSNLTISTRTLQGVAIRPSQPTGGIGNNIRTQVYTTGSCWQYGKYFKYFDLDGNELDYNLADDEVYLPAHTVMENAGTFYDKVIEQSFGGYDDFIEAYKKYSRGTNSHQDYSLIFKTLLKDGVKVIGLDLNGGETVYVKTSATKQKKLKAVGYYYVTDGKSANSELYFVTDNFCEDYAVSEDKGKQYVTDYGVQTESERYGRIIVATDNQTASTLFMLKTKGNTYYNAMRNKVYDDAYQTADAIDGMKVVFYAAGGIFGLFAILMLFNFISVTVSTKKKEIGILRAIGARKIDVFKIFFIEALIITLSCFVVSVGLSAAACIIINDYLITSAVGVSALDFGILSVLILLLSTVAVALVATVLPVNKAAKKPPVESIRSV